MLGRADYRQPVAETSQAEKSERDAPQKSESLLTVLVAFGANLLIAVAKSVAALITGSASMVAEAAHSWADAGNEIFLLVADRRSARQRDSAHPLGYGREAYVWSMFAAFGLFSAGAVVSIWHGITELINPEPATDYLIAYIVLGIAFVLEGVSFLQALRQTRRGAESLDREPIWHVLNTSNPTLRAVFFEDAAALIGLLLAVVAVLLIDRNRRFLVGEEVDPVLRGAVLKGLTEHPEIDRVTYLHLEFVGPGRTYLVAAVDMTGEDTEPNLAVRLRRVERELEQNENVEEAVLTLSIPDEPTIT